MIPLMISTIEDPDDREFMEYLYLSYNRLMYSEIRKFLKNEWDVEDVLQSVLVKLIDKIALLRGFSRNQQVNYIIVASRNTALNFLRDRKKMSAFSFNEDSDWPDEGEFSGDRRLEWIESMEDAGKAWRDLDEKSRRLLEMKYFLDMSNEEIAKEIGVKTDSVRMLLTRARNAMKEKMTSADID